MKRFLAMFVSAAKVLSLVTAFAFAPALSTPAAAQQPCQWNYAAPGNVSTATYCGNVNVAGTITGQASNTVPSIAAMQALPNPSSISAVIVTGQQGAGYVFQWIAGALPCNAVSGGGDGGTTFCGSNGTGGYLTSGYWKRQFIGPLYVNWFSPLDLTTDTNDATAAFRLAMAATKGTVATRCGTYYVSGSFGFGGFQTSPYANSATILDFQGCGILDSHIPAADHFTGDGSTTVFTLASPSNGDNLIVYVNNSQKIGGYTISGNALTFGAPPANNANILVQRDLITWTGLNSVIQNGTVYGNYVGGPCLAARSDDFITLHNMTFYYCNNGAVQFAPSTDYGPGWIENVKTENVYTNGIRQACYIFRLNPSSFINQGVADTLHCRSDFNLTAIAATISNGANSAAITGYRAWPEDVGRDVQIPGAGTAGGILNTWITSVSSNGLTLTLHNNASTSVTASASTIGSTASREFINDCQGTGGCKTAVWNFNGGELDAGHSVYGWHEVDLSSGYEEAFLSFNESIESTANTSAPGCAIDLPNFAGFNAQGETLGINFALGLTCPGSLANQYNFQVSGTASTTLPFQAAGITSTANVTAANFSPNLAHSVSVPVDGVTHTIYAGAGIGGAQVQLYGTGQTCVDRINFVQYGSAAAYGAVGGAGCPARTYTMSGSDLQLSMTGGTGGPYTAYVTLIP